MPATYKNGFRILDMQPSEDLKTFLAKIYWASFSVAWSGSKIKVISLQVK